MKFKHLEVHNFLTIKYASLNLMDRGLNVIQGINDDDTSATSNGSGKSSLADALSWCLYGMTARDVKGDAVVNNQVKKDCVVRTEIQSGDTTYRVSRYRKHKEFKNSLRLEFFDVKTGLYEDLSKGTDTETQKEVERVMGCSQEVFVAAIYSGQEIMPDLPKMGDRDLKRIIEEGAGLQRIERAYGEARVRRGAIAASRDATDAQVGNIKTRIARDESALLIKQTEADAWEAARKTRVDQATEYLRAVNVGLEEYRTAVVKQKPIHDARLAEIASIDTSLAAHSALSAAARAATKAVSDANAAVNRGALQRAIEQIKATQAQIENAPAEMAKPCDECGKPHTPEELAEFVAHRTSRLLEQEANLAGLKVLVAKQLDVVRASRELEEKALAAVPDVSVVNARRVALVTDCKKFDTVVLELRRLKSESEAAAVTLEVRTSEVNPLADTLKVLREQVASDVAKLTALQETLAKQQKELDVADHVVKVFGPAGVRAQILDTVTPYLNERTADYLSVLSDGNIQATWTTLTRSAAGELKEKFSIDVDHAKGGDSFKALSGGEKRKVRLATALALQDLVASRATQPIDLWIGDEVDDALDPAALERLMTILERKARERGTVLLVSHADLSDWADQVTTVRKSGGVSVVEGSLCS